MDDVTLFHLIDDARVLCDFGALELYKPDHPELGYFRIDMFPNDIYATTQTRYAYRDDSLDTEPYYIGYTYRDECGNTECYAGFLPDKIDRGDGQGLRPALWVERGVNMQDTGWRITPGTWNYMSLHLKQYVVAFQSAKEFVG